MMRSHHFLLSASQRLNSIRRPAKAAMQLLTALVVLFLWLFPNLATAASPHIYDVPHLGHAGSQTTVLGNEWDPNATLDIYFDSTDVGLVDTDNNGSFGMALRAPTIRQDGLTIQIPKDAAPGQHWITAVERITQLQAQVPFTVWSTTDWSQYQFDAQHTAFNPYETVLDKSNVQSLVQRWNYTTANGFWDSPVLANGKLYVAADNLYALDATTGALLWQYAGQMFLGAGAPAVADGLVYVCTVGNIVALNADTGSWVWTRSLGDNSCQDMPAVADGVLYFNSQPPGSFTELDALDAGTGTLLWRHASLWSVSEPAVADGVVYVGSVNSNVYALDARTGALLWTYTAGDWVAAPPVVANGIVYVSSKEVFPLYALYALDAKTGALIWKRETSDSPIEATAVANGVVYFVYDDYNLSAGILCAADAATGTLLWKHVFEGAEGASAAVANGVLYVGSGYSLYALDANTGGLLSTYTTPSWNVISPTVDNGMVYVISAYGNTLYAFGLPNQQISQKFSPPERPDPARLTPNWGLQPNTVVTPAKK
jgi:outer membrane protein assembly factor BamB